MTDIDRLIVEVEAHDAKATKGPWRTGRGLVALGVYADGPYGRKGHICHKILNGHKHHPSPADMRALNDLPMIAHYRTAAPTLASALKELREAVRDHIRSYSDKGGCPRMTFDRLAALVGWEGGGDD